MSLTINKKRAIMRKACELCGGHDAGIVVAD